MHVPLPTVVVRVECRGRDGSYLVGAGEVDVHPRRPSVGDRVHQQGGAWTHTHGTRFSVVTRRAPAAMSTPIETRIQK